MCSVSKFTKGSYSTDKPFYFHEETLNIKCDEGFQLRYEYIEYYNVQKYNNVSVNDLQINAICFHGDIYLNDSIELTKIDCEPSNFFCSYVQVLTISAINCKT